MELHSDRRQNVWESRGSELDQVLQEAIPASASMEESERKQETDFGLMDQHTCPDKGMHRVRVK